MKTELDIIYTIWDIVRGGSSNADDPINERLMRAFLSIHRGNRLNQNFEQGNTLPDEVFQYLGPIPFTLKDGEFVSPTVPKFISFKENTGVSAELDGYQVSVVRSEEWRSARKHRFNKHHPLIKIVNHKMIMSKGLLQANQGLDDHTGSLLNTVVAMLAAIAEDATVDVDIQAVLVDPDDEPGYDFTSSPYPYPDELIEDLITSVNAREFNLFLQTRSDETGDMRNNATPENTRQEF